MASPSSSSTSPLPSLRDARQDRSLRLWGGDGQELLEAGHVVLLGGTSTGSEVLKNTILPGLGRFTIVDAEKVTKRDLGNNFFLEQADLGADRAPALLRVLGELNPESKGAAVVRDPNELIVNDIDFFEREDVRIVVVSSLVTTASLVALSRALEGKEIPIMYVQGTGLVGLLRVQADPRYIIDAVPDPELRIIDLRIVNPFPALRDFFDRHDPNDPTMEIDAHSHLPWPLIMYHAIKKVRCDRSDDAFLPNSLADWREVRAAIAGMIRRVQPIQDNFEEAKANANAAKLYVQRRNLPELQAILADPRAAAPSAGDAQFWFLAHGLKRFRDTNGSFPTTSDIPDFTCTTQWYLELKEIFNAQQEKDIREVAGYVLQALEASGQPLASRSAAEQGQLMGQVEQVCKHCWELTHLTFKPFHAEVADQGAPLDPSTIRNSEDPAFSWYVAFRAGRRFFEKHGRFVGSCSDDALDADKTAMVDEVAALLGSSDAASPHAEIAKEFVRYGGGEPVTIASIIGAVAAQEVIKLLQNKRVPVCDTLVYDGIVAKFTTFTL